jgi:hypothetical protein
MSEQPRILIAGTVTHYLWQCPHCQYLVKHPWMGRHRHGGPFITTAVQQEGLRIVAEHIKKEHADEQINPK